MKRFFAPLTLVLPIIALLASHTAHAARENGTNDDVEQYYGLASRVGLFSANILAPISQAGVLVYQLGGGYWAEKEPNGEWGKRLFAATGLGVSIEAGALTVSGTASPGAVNDPTAQLGLSPRLVNDISVSLSDSENTRAIVAQFKNISAGHEPAVNSDRYFLTLEMTARF